MRLFIVPFLLFFITSFSYAEELLEFNESEAINFNALGNQESNILYQPHFQECFDRGNQALRTGKIDEAIQWLQRAIQEKPNAPQSHFNLGIAYETKGDINKAIEAYKDAILQRLDYPKAHNQLAKLLQQKGEIDQAIIHFEQASRFDPKLSEPAITAARLLVEKERYKEAIPHFEKAIQLIPTDIQLAFEYANALNTINETEKALTVYEKLLEKRPHDSGILYNTAYTLKKLGRIDNALHYYQATLQKNPHHVEAHFSLGLAYLAQGDFKKGWPEYEWRWQRNTQQMKRNFRQPQWDGTPLQGKTILLHAEQGLGDTLQFIRYAKLVKEQYGGTVIVAVQKPLLDIISRCCPYIDQVTLLSQLPAHFDVHAPLMSLPLILGTHLETVPVEIPYIIPDPTLVGQWHEKLKNDSNLKIGICWQGNSKYSTPFLRAVVAAKSLAMQKFAPLAAIPGISLYSLQRETGIEQLQHMSEGFNLHIFDQDFDQTNGRFMDTAAVMKQLDLVITIDTSTAHLAGAIGIPVWVMLPEPADWRWMFKRTDSPWYPKNMRLFRQPSSGDWDTVIATISHELKQFVTQKKDTSPLPIHPSVTDPSPLHTKLALISSKLKKQCAILMTLSASDDNKQFIKTVSVIHHLAQMRKKLQFKINILERE